MSGLPISAEALTNCLEAIRIEDYAASMGITRIVPTNITELLKNSDKNRIMCILGCDEKYRNGQASDFEYFAEWERVFPLCVGTGAAEWYREERSLLGIDSDASVCERWRAGNERVASRIPDDEQCSHIDVNKFVSNFEKEGAESAATYAELFAAVRTAIQRMETKEIHLIGKLSANEFAKPSPYGAQAAWRRICCGEKLNESERDTLIAQLLIDAILFVKKDWNRSVILHLRAERFRDLATYFAEHRLLPDELRIGISLDTVPPSLIDLCAASEKGARILPELILLPSDLSRGLTERLLALFAVYPVGGMRFGGIDTDAPLLEAGHRLFKRGFALALTELCVSRAHAEAIAREFFKS